ncbi:MAG: penicillin-binding protein 1A [Burkholderiaceae bacterium]
MPPSTPSKRPPRKSRKDRHWLRLTLTLLAIPAALALTGALAVALAVLLANDRLPPLDALAEYRPKIPLRVFTADGVLIGEFGEERRSVVRIEDVPAVMKNAILAAEDAGFFEHSGVDMKGIARAALSNFSAGGIQQGASTITMQLARNFFLSSERTYIRKIYEILVAFKIEQNFSKDQILEIYINQIFLGKRAWGFASASQVYFGKPLAQVTPAEAAMLAGLPKAPSRFNPIENPKRATERQRYILRRMREFNFLSDAQYQQALEQKLTFGDTTNTEFALKAPYVAELARQLAFDAYRDETYTAGLNVYTTVMSDDQRAASLAIKQGVIDYDRKHGYRGPEAYVDLPADKARRDAAIENALADAPDVDEFKTAVVLAAEPRKVRVSRSHDSEIEIEPEGLKFAAISLTDKVPAARRIRPGAVVRVVETKPDQWELTQLPAVESALVATNTRDGSVRALVGGFHFDRNKFNRATQAWRQPGSSFKPFIYSASLDKGLMTSTLINDAPLNLPAAMTGGQIWDPKNYDARFEGPMTMRQALQKSKNLVSIRILQTIGTQYAQDYVTRFGFDAERHPAYLTMALGAGSVTPWQMAGAISVFANGGYRVDPYLIRRITDAEGRVIAEAHPAEAGDESRRAIDARNAFIMDSMMRDVVRRGTATKAMSLKRDDLAGKTGTTNDAYDAWFVGYQPSVAAAVWMGFDKPAKLGDRETGGGLALPIWISFMRQALKGVPDAAPTVPPGVVQINGEWYYAEAQPGQGVSAIGISEGGVGNGENADQVRDQVF